MSAPCRHEGREELQDHKEFLKLTRWTRSSHQRLVPIDEARQRKVLNLRGDMDAVAVGLPRNAFELGAAVSPRVMTTQQGRGVRMSCSKVERAAMYLVRTRRTGSTRTTKATKQVVNHEELEKALKEMGVQG